MKKLRKVLACFLSLFLAAGLLTGCKKEKEEEPVNINDLRTGNFKYDFAEFLDIKLYGYEGHGFIEVKPLDFTVDDFDSEEDYIKTKKAIDSMKLYLTPGNSSVSSNLTVTPSENLSNGDIVIFSLSEGFTVPDGLSINTMPFQLQIAGLTGPKEIDLFDPMNVQFWGLDGTSEVYAEKQTTGNLPEEVAQNITYSIKMDTEKVEQGKSILNVHADMDPKFLNNKENPYYTTDVYFGKMAYEAERDSEIVLRNVAYPMDMNNEDQKLLGSAIMNEVKKTEVGKSISNVASIQQDENPSDPYSYLITLDTKDDKCMRADVRLAKIFEEYKVVSLSNITSWVSAKGSSCADSYNGKIVLARFVKGSSQTPVGRETKKTEEETPEGTPEASASPAPSAEPTPEATPETGPEETPQTDLELPMEAAEPVVEVTN